MSVSKMASFLSQLSRSQFFSTENDHRVTVAPCTPDTLVTEVLARPTPDGEPSDLLVAYVDDRDQIQVLVISPLGASDFGQSKAKCQRFGGTTTISMLHDVAKATGETLFQLNTWITGTASVSDEILDGLPA